MLDLTARLRRAPGVTFELTSGEAAAAPTAVLINPASRVYYTLDSLGTQFWQLVDGERTFEAIVAALAPARADHIEALEAELAELAGSLVQERFLEVV
ncbi:MAG: PqqD family protein [Ardenticatenaceae bacterium]|nr:PqqD family protein [Ardenticatenaceae bacterium]